MTRSTPIQHDPPLTITQAAEYSGFSPSTIRRRIRAGALPASQFGSRQYRIRQSALDAWLANGDPR